MAALPRNAGRPFCRANARGVLCSSCPGKLYAQCHRQQLAPLCDAIAFDTQQGGRAGKGVDLASHTVRLFLARARWQGHSAAAVFVDLKSAFYGVLTEEAVGPLHDEGARRSLLARLGLESHDVEDFEQALRTGGGALQESGPQRHYAGPSLIGTWRHGSAWRVRRGWSSRTWVYGQGIPLRI